MRVLVTGVNGLLGRTVASLFAGRDDHVVGLSRAAPLELPQGVNFVAADLLDRTALDAAVGNVDAVTHCAFALDGDFPDHERRVNLEGTAANVVGAAEAAGVKRAVFMSSLAAYGPRLTVEQPPSHETDSLTTGPEHIYGWQTAECERLIEQSSLPCVRVRAVGYTALFDTCGAVVTDIGGAMSHAAVVAREYGVPCVVDTQVAAARIPSGAVVEVDGEAGVVTVLEAAPVGECDARRSCRVGTAMRDYSPREK
jgi:uncharacterized protein YbjT (DUF2867 family)